MTKSERAAMMDERVSFLREQTQAIRSAAILCRLGFEPQVYGVFKEVAAERGEEAARIKRWLGIT